MQFSQNPQSLSNSILLFSAEFSPASYLLHQTFFVSKHSRTGTDRSRFCQVRSVKNLKPQRNTAYSLTCFMVLPELRLHYSVRLSFTYKLDISEEFHDFSCSEIFAFGVVNLVISITNIVHGANRALKSLQEIFSVTNVRSWSG